METLLVVLCTVSACLAILAVGIGIGVRMGERELGKLLDRIHESNSAFADGLVNTTQETLNDFRKRMLEENGYEFKNNVLKVIKEDPLSDVQTKVVGLMARRVSGLIRDVDFLKQHLGVVSEPKTND